MAKPIGAILMNDEGEDEEADGLHRQLRFVMQNLHFAARAKGIELGPVSARRVLEMAENGELAQISAAVDAVRGELVRQ